MSASARWQAPISTSTNAAASTSASFSAARSSAKQQQQHPETFEEIQRRQNAAAVLGRPEMLGWIANARGETIPQTRHRYLAILAGLDPSSLPPNGYTEAKSTDVPPSSQAALGTTDTPARRMNRKGKGKGKETTKNRETNANEQDVQSPREKEKYKEPRRHSSATSGTVARRGGPRAEKGVKVEGPSPSGNSKEKPRRRGRYSEPGSGSGGGGGDAGRSSAGADDGGVDGREDAAR